mmetsp:Transcript_27947/g.76894  ORF Transcript_27947/g.76894 Transcript_27947/m.76894 type:complete len:310 (-) Transcript_27947:88-1017(-)
MKQQFALQKDFILPRLRALGIVGQLPGFQGNVPIQLKHMFHDVNITRQGGTGWMDSLDPLFDRISDMYMKTLIGEFGTDHWYQLDGYFNGGTAPWRRRSLESENGSNVSHNEAWFQRGKKAYESLIRTDPKAIWSFQGFSFVSWSSEREASALKGFIDSVPLGKFVIMDMAWPGPGEWQKWNNASFFGAPFVWTSLHNFGGTDGMKGDLNRLNRVPHQILAPISTVFGVGGTPEGIDHNCAYYEFLFDSVFREAPVSDLNQHMARRSNKRYDLGENLVKMKEAHTIRLLLEEAWSLLTNSVYSTDFMNI